jgi:hypothetical protein
MGNVATSIGNSHHQRPNLILVEEGVFDVWQCRQLIRILRFLKIDAVLTPATFVENCNHSRMVVQACTDTTIDQVSFVFVA